MRERDERGGGGVNPKWQSGSLRVGVDGELIHVCVCVYPV